MDNTKEPKRFSACNDSINSWDENIFLGTDYQTGTYAFWGNDIRVLNIGCTNTPSTIAISDTAFGNNTNLQSVTFRMNRIPEVGYSIFYNCGNNFTIYVPSNRLSAYQTATNLSQYSSKMVGE